MSSAARSRGGFVDTSTPEQCFPMRVTLSSPGTFKENIFGHIQPNARRISKYIHRNRIDRPQDSRKIFSRVSAVSTLRDCSSLLVKLESMEILYARQKE